MGREWRWGFCFVKHLPDLVAGCGCCGSSGETEGHHRFPDPHNTGIAGSWREGWAGHRGVSSCNTHPRGLCNPSQESQLWNLETTPQNKSLFPLASRSVFFMGIPSSLSYLGFFVNGWKEQSRPSPFVICYPSPALIKNGCFGPGSLEWADTWRVKPGPHLLNINSCSNFTPSVPQESDWMWWFKRGNFPTVIISLVNNQYSSPHQLFKCVAQIFFLCHWSF